MSGRSARLAVIGIVLVDVACSGAGPSQPPKTATVPAASVPVNSPQAAARTNGENFKDMLLALCIANAFKGEPAGADASSSFSALRDWTYYDMENSPNAMKALVDRYLARDYHNPLAEAEAPGMNFQLLKCLDLYHSEEAWLQMQKFVPNPDRTAAEEAAE